jgi:hypothetical protein
MSAIVDLLRRETEQAKARLERAFERTVYNRVGLLVRETMRDIKREAAALGRPFR